MAVVPESIEQLKARKLNELAIELTKLETQNDTTKLYRLGIFKGRVHELEECGVFSWEERRHFDNAAMTACGYEMPQDRVARDTDELQRLGDLISSIEAQRELARSLNQK
ncbi:hypothetical protein [Pseudomonas sp. URIL14HWK12:I6]|uniref:hypothetical protein n=1 Tax=Pseudomonas sp. URIL14HWK12:I6 TaxID=1283293 RepID=UPI0012DC7235|nr:hypothetical protein [Pseudomonas sp. URIL14HWK12:I6]